MTLSCTLIPSAFTQPIETTSVSVKGLDLAVQMNDVDFNSRGMLAGKFDIAEMSMGTFVGAKSNGADLIAIPVFLGRRFLQPCVFFGDAAGIGSPGDLRGKRIALPQFWMTSSIWHRGVLEREYGVPASTCTFLTTQNERADDPFTPGVAVEQLYNRPLFEFFDMIPDLIAKGTADVVFAPKLPKPNQRAGLHGLFADPVQASLDSYAATGIYPLMHTIVVRGSLVREQPQLAAQLLELFEKAKGYAYDHAHAVEVETPIPGRTFDEARTLLGEPYPFGRAVNARAVEAFLGYAADQHLSKGNVTLEGAFANV